MGAFMSQPRLGMGIGQAMIGRTGQRYRIQKIIRERPDSEFKVLQATCNDKNFVVKTVTPYQFEKAGIIKSALPRTTFVRLPVDEIQDQNALVYDYATEDLRRLAMRVKFNRPQIKRICRDILQAIADLHDADWMHGDVKTENVLVDYTTMPDGGVDIERVYLIDIETALPIKDEYYMYDIEIGHPFWRSPEAHARRVIGKPADVFSFGLIVINLVTGGKGFILDPGPLTEEHSPMLYGLQRISYFFGEYPEAFAKRLGKGVPEDEKMWSALLGDLNSELKKPNQYAPFSHWDPAEVASEDSAFVWSFMKKLDPVRRTRARELLKDAWFDT